MIDVVCVEETVQNASSSKDFGTNTVLGGVSNFSFLFKLTGNCQCISVNQ